MNIIKNKINQLLIYFKPQELSKYDAIKVAIDVADAKFEIVEDKEKLVGQMGIWDEKLQKGRPFTKEDVGDANIAFLEQITDILNRSCDIHCKNTKITNAQSKEILKLANFIEYETDYFMKLKEHSLKQRNIDTKRKNPLFSYEEEAFKTFDEYKQSGKKHIDFGAILRGSRRKSEKESRKFWYKNRLNDLKNNPKPFPDLSDSEIELLLASIGEKKSNYSQYIKEARNEEINKTIFAAKANGFIID